MKKEFHAIFKINKMTVFNVSYYTLGTNEKPHFTTSACVFIRSKRDWSRCGQCQDAVLPAGRAKAFYKKWDYMHLKDLTQEQYDEMRKDLDVLLDYYKSEIKEYQGKADDVGFSFYSAVKLSKS